MALSKNGVEVADTDTFRSRTHTELGDYTVDIVKLLSKTRSTCYNETMSAHPIKLRERTLRLLDNGHKKTEITELLDISCDSLEKWENLRQETSNLKNNAPKRTAYKIDREKLAKHYEENHHATSKETAVIFGCSPSGIGKAKKSLKITCKKTQINTPNGMKKNAKPLLQK